MQNMQKIIGLCRHRKTVSQMIWSCDKQWRLTRMLGLAQSARKDHLCYNLEPRYLVLFIRTFQTIKRCVVIQNNLVLQSILRLIIFNGNWAKDRSWQWGQKGGENAAMTKGIVKDWRMFQAVFHGHKEDMILRAIYLNMQGMDTGQRLTWGRY